MGQDGVGRLLHYLLHLLLMLILTLLLLLLLLLKPLLLKPLLLVVVLLFPTLLLMPRQDLHVKSVTMLLLLTAMAVMAIVFPYVFL